MGLLKSSEAGRLKSKADTRFNHPLSRVFEVAHFTFSAFGSASRGMIHTERLSQEFLPS